MDQDKNGIGMADDLARALGRLEGRMAAVQEQIVVQSSIIEKNQLEGSAGRSRIYKELEELRQKVLLANERIEDLASDLADNRQVVAEVRRWKERFIGMQILIGGIASALVGAVALFWKWIAAKVGM